MDRTQIWNEVKEIIGDKLGTGKPILRESRISADLGADSLDFIELSMMMEDHFDLEITDEDLEKIETAGELTELVDKYLKRK